MQVTAVKGGRLVTHRAAYLHGAALVSLPAYRSAVVTRLLDRAEAGREREAERRKAIAHLESLVPELPRVRYLVPKTDVRRPSRLPRCRGLSTVQIGQHGPAPRPIATAIATVRVVR